MFTAVGLSRNGVIGVALHWNMLRVLDQTRSNHSASPIIRLFKWIQLKAPSDAKTRHLEMTKREYIYSRFPGSHWTSFCFLKRRENVQIIAQQCLQKPLDYAGNIIIRFPRLHCEHFPAREPIFSGKANVLWQLFLGYRTFIESRRRLLSINKLVYYWSAINCHGNWSLSKWDAKQTV